MKQQKIALLLGASGSVGSELLKALLNTAQYQKTVVFVRKPLPDSHPKLIQKMVPSMTPPALEAAVKEVLDENADFAMVVFSALGIGANTAKLSIDEHRAIDVVLNETFAKSVKSRAESFQLLSAMGANPNASEKGSGAAGMPRYNRVKGESEQAVKLNGPKLVRIFRPGIIKGSQHTPGMIEMAAPLIDLFIPKKFHSISTEEIAKAMVGASLSRDSRIVYSYPEMAEFF